MAAKKKAVKKTAKKASTKKSDARDAVSILQKKYGEATVTTLARERAAVAQMREFIPTGIDVIDHYMLGRGGLPVGRMSEVFGSEASGKTALLYRTMGVCQKIGGHAKLIDAEYSFDEERAEVHGIGSDLVVAQPRDLEECLNMTKDMIRSHNPKKGPQLIGIDSLASLKTRAGVSLEAGEKEFRGEAKLFSNELRDMPRILAAHRTHLFMVNQIRHKIGGSPFESNITTPGGNAPKFYSSVRLQFFGGKGIKNSHDEHTGKVVTVVAVKNRLNSPFLKAKVRLDYATGFNNMWTVAEHAKRMGILKKNPKTGKWDSLEEQFLDALEELGWERHMFDSVVGAVDDGETIGAAESSDDDED